MSKQSPAAQRTTRPGGPTAATDECARATRAAVLCGVLLIGFTAAASEANAQRVQGTVVDAESGAAVSGAGITLLRAGGMALDSTFSDSTGSFTFDAPAPGRYVVRVEHLGFSPLTSDEIRIDGGAVARIELRVTPQPIEMDELLVPGTPRQTAFEQRRLRHGAGRFVTREQIDRRGTARTTDLLREIPGVQVVAGGGPGGWQGSVVSMRGTRGRCEPAFFINGVPMGQRGENTIDQMIQPDMLDGIEIYTSSAATPPEFSQSRGCGVIAFWMRRAEGTRPFSFRRILVATGLVGLILLLVQ